VVLKNKSGEKGEKVIVFGGSEYVGEFKGHAPLLQNKMERRPRHDNTFGVVEENFCCLGRAVGSWCFPRPPPVEPTLCTGCLPCCVCLRVPRSGESRTGTLISMTCTRQVSARAIVACDVTLSRNYGLNMCRGNGAFGPLVRPTRLTAL